MVDVKELPVIQVGKNGVTDAFMTELKAQLKKNKIVKVKMLKSAREDEEFDRKEFAADMASKLRAELLDARGYTFILKKR